jgi:hypothetical protein
MPHDPASYLLPRYKNRSLISARGNLCPASNAVINPAQVSRFSASGATISMLHRSASCLLNSPSATSRCGKPARSFKVMRPPAAQRRRMNVLGGGHRQTTADQPQYPQSASTWDRSAGSGLITPNHARHIGAVEIVQKVNLRQRLIKEYSARS